MSHRRPLESSKRLSARLRVRRAWRLSTQIFIGLAVLLGLVTLLTLATYRDALQERRQAELEAATAIGQTLSAVVDGFVRNVETTVLATVSALAARPAPLDQERDGLYIRTVMDASPALRALFVTDVAGQVIVAREARDVGTDLASRPYVQALRGGAPAVWSDLLFGIQTGTATVAHGREIRSPGGTPMGYVIGAFFPERVFERMHLTLPEDARVTLVDRRGFVLFTTLGPNLPLAARDFSAVPEVRRALAGETVTFQTRRSLQSGQDRFGVIVPVPQTGWAVSFTRPTAILQGTLRAQFTRQAAQVAALILAMGIVAAAFIIRLTRPLSDLAADAAAITRGERPHIAPRGGLLEVTQLAEGMGMMTRAVAEREDALEGARGRLAFLAEASAVLASSLDHATILGHLARLVVPRGADWCVVYTVDPQGRGQRLEVAHADPAAAERARALLNRYAPEVAGPPADALRTGRTVVIDDITDEQLAVLSPREEVREFASEMQLRALMVVPLIARGQTLGALLFAATGARRFGPEDRALAEELARRAAVAVDNARLYEREHTVARTLQQAFLPPMLPQVPGVVLHAAYVPGSAVTEIGGDWYDAFWLPDGRLGLSIGDVTGHGVEAAVVMGQVRQGLRAASWEEPSPAAALGRAGRLLHLMPGEEMATALFGIFDPAKRTFTYASAGHPSPILASPAGEVQALAGGGLPLGMRRATRFRDWTVELPPGTLLVLFTDGLIEFDRNPLEGERVLLEAVRAEASHPSADRAAALQQAALGDRRPPDDVAVITLSMTPIPLGVTELTLPAIPSALPLVRQAVRHAIEAAGLPPDRATALLVATGEAVNNVIEHAYGVIPGDVTVRAEVEGSTLVVTVMDRGRWRPPRADGGGRGMTLMQALADSAQIARTDRGTRVRLEAHLTMVP